MLPRQRDRVNLGLPLLVLLAVALWLRRGHKKDRKNEKRVLKTAEIV